jgi:hypothetical protein
MPTGDVSEKDVDKARDRVEKLRQQLDEENAKVTGSETARNNAVRKARLDAEADRLQQEIDAARNRLKVSSGTEDRLLDQIAVTEEVVDTTPTVADESEKKEK